MNECTDIGLNQRRADDKIVKFDIESRRVEHVLIEAGKENFEHILLIGFRKDGTFQVRGTAEQSVLRSLGALQIIEHDLIENLR